MGLPAVLSMCSKGEWTTRSPFLEGSRRVLWWTDSIYIHWSSSAHHSFGSCELYEYMIVVIATESDLWSISEIIFPSDCQWDLRLLHQLGILEMKPGNNYMSRM